MKEYELIREQFGTCDGQPKSTVQEISIDDPDEYMKQFITPKAVCNKSDLGNGSIEYDIVDKETHTRFVFSPL